MIVQAPPRRTYAHAWATWWVLPFLPLCIVVTLFYGAWTGCRRIAWRKGARGWPK